MIGLASAGCSRAVRRRPNAALVAESKRSGSSSSGGAVASGMSSSVALWLKLYRLKSVGANTYYRVVG